MTKKIVKKVWKNFEIIKVKLNPEQAVLSCCQIAESKEAVTIGPSTQCNDFCPTFHISDTSS